MKYIGFIKEHTDIVASLNYKETFGQVKNNPQTIEKICNYLKKGYPVNGCLSYFFDLETNERIDSIFFDTDLVYVWPTYFPYYLAKNPYYVLDQDFVNHLESKNFKYKKFRYFERKEALKLEETLGFELIEASSRAIEKRNNDSIIT